MSQWINHEAVYRTAPATPGLLIIKTDKIDYQLVVLDAFDI